MLFILIAIISTTMLVSCANNNNDLSASVQERAISFAEIEELKLLAEQGYADKQLDLGVRLYFGIDINQDYERAVFWITRAVEQGNAIAQNNLGWHYQYGLGVEQSYEQAVPWYRKAIAQGNPHAQVNLETLPVQYR